MPRRYSTDEVDAALRRIGFSPERQRGSHQRYIGRWRGAARYVTLIAGRKEIDPRTLSSICHQAAITRSELHRLISGEHISE